MVALTFFHYLYNPLRWLGLGAVAVGIPPIVRRSLISLKRCILDINVLMLIAVGGAVFLGDYLEAGSVVFLFTLADWLESRSSDKARMALASVVRLAPQIAILVDSGTKVPVAEVEVGSILSVKAGELVPIDGIVIFGKSAVDESSLSGESVLVQKEVGATVWAGTLNITGYLSVQTTALAEESAVSRMVKLVEEAQTLRSNVEKLIEKFAKYYTPVVVLAATGIAIIPFFVHAHNRRHWLYVALVLLVVACPCALVISTPVATTCAIARAAKMGLIVKSGSALEALGKLKVLALDKTGTLTEGHFQVIDVRALGQNMDLARLLHWIACIESQSSHPLAASLVAYAKLHGIAPLDKVEGFEVLAGEGVCGVISGHTVHIGNERLARRFSWTEDDALEPALMESWRNQGWSISWVGQDENLAGIFCAGDPLRVEAQEFVQIMKRCGVHLVMLTGDSLAAATMTQKKLGELEVHAQLFPQDKVDILSRIKTRLGCTGMVGDGINDAPALAVADVGIAMGVAGSAVAMETADVALMTNDLRQLAAAVKLGRRVRWKIWQNIVLSLATKLLIILLAAFGFASLWAAVLADVGTCLVVIFNSMLLLGRGKFEKHRGHHHHHGHDHHHHNSCPDSGCAHSNLDEKNDRQYDHSQISHLTVGEHRHQHHHPASRHGHGHCHLAKTGNDHYHGHQQHVKHDLHSISCDKKGICYLKVKILDSLNCCVASNKLQGRECCGNQFVVKGSGSNARKRCGKDTAVSALEVNCSCSTSAVQACIAELPLTNCKLESSETDLCAAYCAK
ncbi:hypothetical protein GOP47_0024281 [Adiantum capillus-veneris]|uniref:P-type ATPase A domain-containing protein n=1 Tax=Adiantum capillus-veneris TaxID=13818 RepID=A0A9D4U556_ADICA|nr:hypothetical protein GOP47_0024281 [Adiantum capillus-veneris]